MGKGRHVRTLPSIVDPRSSETAAGAAAAAAAAAAARGGAARSLYELPKPPSSQVPSSAYSGDPTQSFEHRQAGESGVGGDGDGAGGGGDGEGGGGDGEGG
eukprot:jgi/Chrpa1/27581/Chrysochromulina_OHIO_Genome00025706-RA